MLVDLINNSSFKEHLYWRKYDNDCKAIVRLIDWERGTPYTYRFFDLEELKESQLLFARKFDDSIDSDIILSIKKMVLNERV